MMRRRVKGLVAVGLTVSVIGIAWALVPYRPEPRQIMTLPLVRDQQTTGPLRVSGDNPRYFVDRHGQPVYLTGSHTWANLQDSGPTDPPLRFDFPAYLDFLERHNHNFVRLWVWENASRAPWVTSDYFIEPSPFARVGPGIAIDGKPRFDLTRFNDAFFTRLRKRVKAAGERGIYVSIMLFDGWSVEDKDLGLGNPWPGHPFHRDNNINGVDGDPGGNGEGEEIHTLELPKVTRIQERYVRYVIEAVGDMDNVLYEISNESHGGSEAWQYHMIRYIKDYERNRELQHPVGMTVEWHDGSNEELLSGPADWISPRPAQRGVDHPPPNNAGKVVLYDSDHICGVCGDTDWVWKSFLRGVNVIFMDPYDGQATGLGVPKDYDPTNPRWEQIRRQMGYALSIAKQVDLGSARPLEGGCSSDFCMVAESAEGVEYLAYLPSRFWRGFRLPGGGSLTLDVGVEPRRFGVQWLNPSAGELAVVDDISAAGVVRLRSPFGSPALLLLRSKAAAGVRDHELH